MKFEDFVEEVRKGVKRVLGNDFIVKSNQVLKNNNILLTGISIEEKSNNIHPNIYINDFYDEYKNGRCLSAIIFQIVAIYQQGKMKKAIDMEYFKDFEKVKEDIVFKIVNYEKNKKMLEEIPYIKVLDLAVIFSYRIHNEIFQNASIQINNQHINMWRVGKEDLISVAKENTERLLPKDIKNMQDVIRETVMENIQDEAITAQILDSFKMDDEKTSMYVLTNVMKVNGAACIFYQGVLKEFANGMQKDIYILPSSVHEVILIPTEEKREATYLAKMVEEVNETELSGEEILSNNVYYYSRKNDELVLCDK